MCSPTICSRPSPRSSDLLTRRDDQRPSAGRSRDLLGPIPVHIITTSVCLLRSAKQTTCKRAGNVSFGTINGHSHSLTTPQGSMHQQDGPLDATERIFGTTAENELA